MKKFAALAVVLMFAGSAWCADIVSVEREGMILRSEFNRLGSSADPFEREAVLRKIIDKCKELKKAKWHIGTWRTCTLMSSLKR